MKAKIAVLPGDGIGPEVTAEAVKVLGAVADRFGHQFEYNQALIGGAAMDATGDPLPNETMDLCLASDAVLLGAIGTPKYDDTRAAKRPEQGLLGLRKNLDLFANLRPVKLYPSLLSASTIKESALQGVDLMVVRELTGGLYFGKPSERWIDQKGQRHAVDTMAYSDWEIERVVRRACEVARTRRRKVTSVDKANVLTSSRLWREVAIEVAAQFPDLTFEHMLVDTCAMQLVRRPAQFDVIVTENTFGDIITDEASMLAGSMGMLASASLSSGTLGMYEPIHGSAPKYAGQNVANPIATILSGAMLLRHSLNLAAEAEAIDAAVNVVLEDGYRTYDIMSEGRVKVSTSQMGDLIANRIRSI